MRKTSIVTSFALAALLGAAAIAAQKKPVESKRDTPLKVNSVSAELALTGIPLQMTPGQLPHQFSSQLRNDVDRSRGIAILRQKGNDIEYTFAWWGLTSPVTQAHFHYGPKNQVAVRAFSICGVKGESPECPGGASNSLSGIWKGADIAAVKSGDIVIAFHTQKYPPPIGEFAVYVPAEKAK
jgi:hypothetical protein